MKTIEQTIDQLIEANSVKYDVSADLMHHIVKYESTYNPTAEGDVKYVCTAKKSPLYNQTAPSYGLVQINTCWHPDVSYAQATDPAFALEFLAKNLSEGKCYLWSTCPL